MIVRISALALATALVSGAAFAAATPMDDLKAAKDLTSHSKFAAAFDKTEKAETGLLNQQQTGDKSDQQALNDVKKAHEDLAQKNRQAAMTDLDSAMNDMGSK